MNAVTLTVRHKDGTTEARCVDIEVLGSGLVQFAPAVNLDPGDEVTIDWGTYVVPADSRRFEMNFPCTTSELAWYVDKDGKMHGGIVI